MRTHYYVYKIGGSGPQYRHEMLTDAQLEAERLAQQEPGECFEILMCVGHSTSSAVNTFWRNGVDPDSLA